MRCPTPRGQIGCTITPTILRSLDKSPRQDLGKPAFSSLLYLLSEITGIWNLLPDPYMHGAGYSIIPPKGKFDVHIDSNADLTNGLIRRLALIIYLNRDWSPD